MNSLTVETPRERRNTGATSDDADGDDDEAAGDGTRRKGSLMPVLTENDLRNLNIGHRDPTSVALLFGQDFASQFCAPEWSRSSPLPYDGVERMLRPGLLPEHAIAATVDGGGGGGGGDVIDDLAPSLSSSPSSPSSLPPLLPSRGLPTLSISPPPPSPLLAIHSLASTSAASADIARAHPDFLQAQSSLIAWIRKETACFGCAFILRSAENNLAVCRVCLLTAGRIASARLLLQIAEDEQLFTDGFYAVSK